MDIIQILAWNIIGMLSLSILPLLYLTQTLINNNWVLPESFSSVIEEDPLGRNRILWMGYIGLMTLSVFFIDTQWNWIWIGGIGLSTSVSLSFFRKEWVDGMVLISLFWIMMVVSVGESNPVWVTAWIGTVLVFSYMDVHRIWAEISWWVFFTLLLWLP